MMNAFWLWFQCGIKILANITITFFGIYCLFNSRYVEALLCGILIELRYPEK